MGEIMKLLLLLTIMGEMRLN